MVERKSRGSTAKEKTATLSDPDISELIPPDSSMDGSEVTEAENDTVDDSLSLAEADELDLPPEADSPLLSENTDEDFVEALAYESFPADECAPRKHGIDVDSLILKELGKHRLLKPKEERALAYSIEQTAREYALALFSSRTVIDYALELFSVAVEVKSTAVSLFDLDITGPDNQGRTTMQRMKLWIHANLNTVRSLCSHIDTTASGDLTLENSQGALQLYRRITNVMLDCNLRPSTLRHLERYLHEYIKQERPRKDEYAGKIDLQAELEAITTASRAYHETRNSMVLANLRLAVHHARNRRYFKGVHFTDLTSPAFEGLITGIEKFSVERGFKISTYVTSWIKQRIGRMLLEDTRDIGLPVHLSHRLSKVERLSERFIATHGRPPELEEIATTLGIARPRDLESIKEGRREIYSGNFPAAPVASGVEGELFDILPDSDESPVEKSVAAEIQELAQSAFATLDDREKTVLAMRFGIFALLPDRHFEVLKDELDRPERTNFTLHEVGAHLGVTRERIRQLETRALLRVQEHIEFSDVDLAALNWTKNDLKAKNPRKKRDK